MDLEREIEHRASCRHGLHLALGCEHEYLGSKQVELDGIEEIHCVGLRVVQYFLDGTQPVVQFLVVIFGFFLLVFPVCGKALLCQFVHSVRPDLYLDPLSFA